ncbi:MAG: hypothetical protein IKA23_06185 [Akkermansia sp.]|nr:hypothetical protein [Akkermansia sp.]MBR2314996.1 hypothetical protein [Akkermansia sp.]
MKFATLIASIACAVAFSSCCCQPQSMPKLRSMPKDLVPEEQPAQVATPEQPVKVLGTKGK